MSRPCPCQSKKTYEACCQPYHDGKKAADTAALLMRTRYAAYAMAKADYLMRTTEAGEREKLDRAELTEYCRSVKCVGLKIVKAEAGGPEDQEGTVTFQASLQVNGKRHLHIEKSRFVREGGRWVYLDGETN